MSDASRSPSRSPRKRKERSVSRSRSRSSTPPRRRLSRSGSRDLSDSRSRSRTPIDGARLHISDIGHHISSRDLEREFRKFGRLMEVWMSKSRTSPTFAFVVYRHVKDAEKAMRDMDGVSINGNRIRVSVARPRTWSSRNSGPSGGGGSGFQSDLRCYSCSRRGHFARDCPDAFGGGGGGGGGAQSDLRCYSCSRKGHFARDCPEASDRERDRSPRRSSSYRNGR